MMLAHIGNWLPVHNWCPRANGVGEHAPRFPPRAFAVTTQRQRERRLLGQIEQVGELVDDDAAELFGVHDGDGAAVPACHVMADADGDQFDGGFALYPADHLTQVLVEVAARIDAEC